MLSYLITFHETDGNDCRVYDAIVQAMNRDAAFAILAKSIEEKLEGQDYEDDGSELGYYYHCGDDCPEDCEGHGGIALRDVREYASHEEAVKNLAVSHSRWEV